MRTQYERLTSCTEWFLYCNFADMECLFSQGKSQFGVCHSWRAFDRVHIGLLRDSSILFFIFAKIYSFDEWTVQYQFSVFEVLRQYHIVSYFLELKGRMENITIDKMSLFVWKWSNDRRGLYLERHWECRPKQSYCIVH